MNRFYHVTFGVMIVGLLIPLLLRAVDAAGA